MALRDELGRAIRSERERRGMSQSALAEAVGVSLQSIGKIERGRSAPSFDTLEAIGRVLAVPVREFFPAGNAAADPPAVRITALLAPLTGAEREQAERLLYAFRNARTAADREQAERVIVALLSGNR
jgi:transcriptional regulator with XRE-family HTH domain